VAIAANYGLVHLKGIYTQTKRTAGLPDLYLDTTGVAFVAGSQVQLPVRLGSNASQIPAVAGIAAHVLIDGVLPLSAPAISYASGWLGTPANTLHFTKAVGLGRLDWTYARIDKHNAAGYGTLAIVSFTIPPATQGQQMSVHFDKVMLVDSNGSPITQFNILDDTVTILSPIGVRSSVHHTVQMYVAPNPSKGICNVSLSLAHAGNFQIVLRDITGKLLLHYEGNGNAGFQNISLPTDQLAAGIYFISGAAQGGRFVPVRWVKE
jgi:hypothetical protein